MSKFSARICTFSEKRGSIAPMTRDTPIRDIDVLVVGDANPDLILRGDVVPRFGQSEQLLDSADFLAGGSGAIVAHGLARLGLRTTMVAVLGADAFGAITREQLAGAGVDVTELRVDPELPTGLTVILNHLDSRTMLTLVGSIGSLDPATIDDALLGRARHVHASSFYLQPVLAAGLAELFGRAHRAGASTSLDTNLDPAGDWAGLEQVLPVTDVLLPNRTEILGIAGRYSDGDSAPFSDPVEAARVIASHGPLVVVKDGEHGAIAVAGGSGSAESGEVLREPGYPVAAIDPAFIAGRLRGLPLAKCLTTACLAGALSTLGVGGTASQATAAQLA
jgi:ribokinase